MSGPYYGKYRGTVVNTRDPQMCGRMLVQVPDVAGFAETSWARPCVPYAGPQVGFFAMPPIGASVWVEFEGGNIDSPIWSGCFWESAAVAPPWVGMRPDVKLLATDLVKIVITDEGAEPGIEIKTQDGARIAITAMGIVIDNGKGAKIEMSGPSVSVNDGALEVT